MDEVDIDLTSKSFIGLIGDNGSGKTTLSQFMIPVACYNVWIPKMIGKQELWYSNGVVEYQLLFNFEPVTTKGDDTSKHSCKGYFIEVDIESGMETDLNPSGSYDAMNKLIEDKLGVNNKILSLFKLNGKKVFIAELTTSERLAFMQNILPGLGDNKKLATKLNDKLLVLNKTIKSNEIKLSRLNSEEFMKDTISDIDESIKRMEIEYNGIEIKREQHEKIVSDIAEYKMKIDICDSNIAKITKIFTLMNTELLNEFIDDDTSVNSLEVKLKNDLEFLQYDIENNEQQLDKIDAGITTLETKEKISLDYSKDEYINLSNYFSEYTNEELTHIMNRDLDEIYNVSQVMVRMSNVKEYFNGYDINVSEILDIAKNIIDDSYYIMKSKESRSKRMKEKHEELKSATANLVKNKAFKDLLKGFDPASTNCTSCGLYNKVKNSSDDYDIFIDNINTLEKEIETIRRDMESEDLLFDLANTYITLYKAINNIEHTIKVYLKDFNIQKYLSKDGLINDAIDILASMKKDKIDLQSFKRMKELERIEKDMNSSDTESIDDLKDRKNNIISTLSILYDKRKKVQEVQRYIQRSYGVDGDQDSMKSLLYKPKFELRILIGEFKDNKDKYISKLKELEATLTSFDPGYGDALKERIEKEKTYRDKVSADLVIRKNMIDEISKHSKIKEEMDVVYTSLSSSLVKKVVRNFMYNLKEYTNNWMSEISLPYKIVDINITDKEFTISVLNELTSTIVPDISMCSDGEKVLVGITLTFAAQNLINLPYNTISLDEVDAQLFPMNKKKFLTAVVNLVNRDGRQAIAISHGENFAMYPNDISLISLRGGDNGYANQYIFKADKE